MPRYEPSDSALRIASLALLFGSVLVCSEQALLAYARNETLLAVGGRPALFAERLLPAGATFVDVTYSFGEDTLYWPGDHSGFHVQRLHYGNTNAGWFYAANRFSSPEHGGTHLDAPLHFAEGHPAVERVPLERLIAPAVVLDMQAAAVEDPDALLGPADIEAFEAEHGPIRPGTIVLVHTGWGTHRFGRPATRALRTLPSRRSSAPTGSFILRRCLSGHHEINRSPCTALHHDVCVGKPCSIPIQLRFSALPSWRSSAPVGLFIS